MAGGPAFLDDVANDVGRERGGRDLGEIEGESGEREIGGGVGVVAVVGFD